MATYSNGDLPAIKKLLEELCTKAEIEDVLRRAGAAFSAAKKTDVINVRVQQALDEKRIQLSQVVALLQDAEEHGRQHVFLFKCDKARAADQANVLSRLEADDRQRLLLLAERLRG